MHHNGKGRAILIAHNYPSCFAHVDEAHVYYMRAVMHAMRLHALALPVVALCIITHWGG